MHGPWKQEVEIRERAGGKQKEVKIERGIVTIPNISHATSYKNQYGS